MDIDADLTRPGLDPAIAPPSTIVAFYHALTGVWYELGMPVADHEYIDCEQLFCPLATDGQAVETLIHVIVFSDQPGTIVLNEA